MTPQISVIVPVYKVEKYLSKCIESILAQTFTNFELLLIDDGSPDQSGIICNEYQQKDSRIRVFHKKNEGVSSARNLGLHHAVGEWVIFCDSDDWVEKDWLESYINTIKESEYDIIFQGYTHDNINKSQTNCIKKNTHEYIKAIFYLEQKDLFGWTWCKIFKNKIIRKHNIQFQKTLSFNEDLLFTLEYCTYANSLLILPIAKYHYVTHSDSLMQRKHSYKELQTKNILIKNARLTLMNKHSVYTEYKKWIYDKYYSDMVICLKILYRNQQLPSYPERKEMLNTINRLKYRPSQLHKSEKLLICLVKVLPYLITDLLLCIYSIARKIG